MFLNLWKPVVSALALMGLFVVSGCASSADSAKADGLTRGMYCPKCETVWVAKPMHQGTKVATMQSERKMTCATCDATAAKVLNSDGTIMLHECPECKATPVIVQPSNPPKLNAPTGSHS